MRLGNGKWLIATGLVAGGLVAYEWHSELGDLIRRHQFQVEGLDQALPSQVYFLSTNRWLEFDVPVGSPLVRLISNASIASTNQSRHGDQWPYAIEYRLEGRRGSILSTGTYHFKAQQLAFVDKQSGEPVEVNFYLQRQYRALGGRRFMLNLTDPGMTNAQVLKLRLQSCHPDLLEVAVRAHFQTKVPERKIGYLWNRLNEDQKRDLARGNVYSFEGLNEREKRGLLRYRWAAAAPDGIPGRDFQRRRLYIRDDSEQLTMLKDWSPSGIPLDAGHRGVLPITNAPGFYQVQLVDHFSTSAWSAVSSTFLWHAQQGTHEIHPFTWSITNQAWWPAERDGFLEVSASRLVSLRAFQVQSGQTNEITPDAVPLLAIPVSPTNSLEYAVDHVGSEPTHFRVDFRRLTALVDEPLGDAITVRYELLARDGSTMQVGDVALTNCQSVYDWLSTRDGLTNISVPQSLCFELPSAVQSLRILSPDESVLVNAYSRPAQMPKKILVPEDYSPANRLKPAEPVWFPVRPPDYHQRRQAGQGSLVRIQARPPQLDPLIEAGQYEWESFLPATEARGQMILLPLTEGKPSRPGSLGFCYFPITVGREERVRLQGEAWETRLSPSLMLVSSDDMPASARVVVDGQVLLESPLSAPVMQIRLGDLDAGEHRIEVSSSQQVAAYLNHVDTGTQPSFLQRFCVMTSSNALHFPYVKRQPGAELLVLKVFSAPEAGPQPFEVRVKLKPAEPRGLGPFASLTMLERVAWVTPSPVRRTHLVAAQPAQLDEGREIFLPVEADVPPGQHDLEVRVVAHSPRWLSLSRTTPGLAEKLEVSSERRLD